MNSEEKIEHQITLKNRSELIMTGITEVIAYNDDKITLKLKDSSLIVNGQKLNIKKLNLEETNIIITGHVIEIIYSDKKEKFSFVKKILNRKNK